MGCKIASFRRHAWIEKPCAPNNLQRGVLRGSSPIFNVIKYYKSKIPRMPPLSRDPEVYEGSTVLGRWVLDTQRGKRRERENDAGEKETPLVRQREISRTRGGGVVSVISTTPLCPALPTYAGGNTWAHRHSRSLPPPLLVALSSACAAGSTGKPKYTNISFSLLLLYIYHRGGKWVVKHEGFCPTLH